MVEVRRAFGRSVMSSIACSECEVQVESTPRSGVAFTRFASQPEFLARVEPVDAIVLSMTIRASGELVYDLGSGTRVTLPTPRTLWFHPHGTSVSLHMENASEAVALAIPTDLVQAAGRPSDVGLRLTTCFHDPLIGGILQHLLQEWERDRARDLLLLESAADIILSRLDIANRSRPPPRVRALSRAF